MEFASLVLPTKVILDSKTATNSYGKFIAEPYQSGYGHTVGNSLRRIALSSLEGSTITAVKIKGVIHEYSTLPNVKEDVINILLNLKRCLNLRQFYYQDYYRLYLFSYIILYFELSHYDMYR